MTTRRYATPAAFKQALESRLRDFAAERDLPMHRVRQLLIFDRFLARVFTEFGTAALLKAGAFLDPVLGEGGGSWSPEVWTWR